MYATNPPEATNKNAARRSVSIVQDEGCTILAIVPSIKKMNNAAAAMNSALAIIECFIVVSFLETIWPYTRVPRRCARIYRNVIPLPERYCIKAVCVETCLAIHGDHAVEENRIIVAVHDLV